MRLEGEVSKLFDPRFSIGTIITLIGAAIGGIWALSEFKSEVRASDHTKEMRLSAIEKKADRYDLKLELLVEVHAEVKAMRAELNRINR